MLTLVPPKNRRPEAVAVNSHCSMTGCVLNITVRKHRLSPAFHYFYFLIVLEAENQRSLPVFPAGWLWRTSGVWVGPRQVLPGWGGELGCGLCSNQQAWGLFPHYQAPQLDSKPHRSQLGPWVLPLCAHCASYSEWRKLQWSCSTQDHSHWCAVCTNSTW